jgi:hypothetical protein
MLHRRPRTIHVGTAGLILRYRDGRISRFCRRCGDFDTPTRLRQARRDAADHASLHEQADAHDVDTPWGVPAAELPRQLRRHATNHALQVSATLGRIIGAALLVAVVALTLTIYASTVR